MNNTGDLRGVGVAAELLRLLNEGGGIRSSADLARRLGTSEELVRMITEDLARRGYLAALDTSCTTACDGCALSAACGTSGSAHTGGGILALTPKGRAAARGRS